MRSQQLKRNIWLFYCIQLLSVASFIYPVFALLLKERLFTTFNVGLVIAIESLVTAALEIPTGYLADRLGRKSMIILMLLCDIGALLLLATAITLPQFFVYALVLGFAAALSSGTLDALLFDTLQELDQTSQHKKILGRIEIIRSIALAIASLAGGLIASLSLVAPVYATLIPTILALVPAFFILEPKFHQPTEQITFIGHVKDSFSTVLQHQQLLMLALILIVGVNIIGPIFDMRPIFYQAKNVPISTFGLFGALGIGLYALGSSASHRVSEYVGNKSAMLLATVGIFILIIAATLLSGIPAAIVLVLSFFAMGIHNPIESHLIHLEIASYKRATVLSSINLGKSLLLAASVPLMGLLADNVGIQRAYQLFSIPCILLLFFLFLLKDKNSTTMRHV